MSFDDLATAMARFDWATTKRDPGAAAEVLHRDFTLVLVTPSPAVVPRDRWLEVLEDYVMHSYLIEEQRIDVDEDVAAVLSRVNMQATVLGDDRSGRFVVSDFWRRENDGWRVWRRHSSPLSAGKMPGV